MGTYLFIAKNNLKKKKSDAIVLLLLIAMSVILIYTGGSAIKNIGLVVDSKADEVNIADYLYITTDENADRLREIVKKYDSIENYEENDILNIPVAGYESADGKNKEFTFLIARESEDREIGKIVTDESYLMKENSIILPYSMETTEGFKVGDEFKLTINGVEYIFEIAAFNEDPMFATTMNISMYRCYISDERWNEILNSDESIKEKLRIECKMVYREGANEDDFLKYIQDEFTEGSVDNKDGIVDIGLQWSMMELGVTMVINVCMGIVVAFAILLVIVSIIILRFSVKTFIEDNLKNIGIMQASGYTSAKMRLVTMLEMFIVTVFGIILGITASVIFGKVVGSIIATMIGLRWNVSFDIGFCAMVIVIMAFIICAIAYRTSAIYKKIDVLSALRGGIHTHNFRKNSLPLENTRLPINMTLGLKSIFGNKLKNIGIVLIAVLLSFATCMSFAVYENFSRDKESMLDIIGMEGGDIQVVGTGMEECGETLEKMEGVECVKYNLVCEITMIYGDKQQNIGADAWRDVTKLENSSVIEGEMPSGDKEIVVSAVVRDTFGLEIGDIVYIKDKDSNYIDYVVVGFNQMVNNMGQRVCFSEDGLKRVFPDMSVVSLFVNIEDGYTFEQMSKNINNLYPEVSVINIKESVEDITTIVSMAMNVICILFVTITIVVVFLVVLLVIKGKVVKEKLNNGIYKALGYTTYDLIVQTTMSNVPVIIAGAIIGTVISIFTTDLAMSKIMSVFGIEKVNMTINPVWLVVTVVGMSLVAILVSVIISARIRKVEPVKMLIDGE